MTSTSTAARADGGEDSRRLCRRGSLAYPRRMNDRLEDSALMLRYQDGDIGAFETLYRRHNDALYRYLLRLSQSPDNAQDIFQDAWGKIIKARANYRPTARFSTYLFRVAHNCFIDHVRRNKRHLHEVATDPDNSPDPAHLPDEQAEQQLARRRLDGLLGNLPAEQRDVYLLYEEGGLTIDEIALATSVNRETAKSRLRYAVAKLKVALAEPAIVNE